jgi:type VI secretion system secreted protein VgrG
MDIPKGGVGTIATVVVDRIMKSEGKTAIQSGRKEYFGFREGNPGFKELTNSISKFGIDSQQTKQLVTTLLTKRAKTVGADKFSDPSVQASILSIAHMRGEGGAQAILNSVAGSPIKRSAKLTNNTVDMINSMSPSEFQDRLRQVRETYDKQIYGNKTDSITRNGKTVTGKWWDLFGKGLTSRYDMERQEFLKLSPRMAQGLTTAQLQ